MLEGESREINSNAQQIRAFRAGNEVWIRRAPAINVIDDYFHEGGHVMGDRISFCGGKVLTPDEAKSTKLSLSEAETNRIEKILLSGKILKERAEMDEFINLGTNILRLFTWGEFRADLLKLHTNVSQKKLIAVIRRMGGVKTLEFTSSDDIIFIDSKEGRNSEMSSYAAELGCLQILINTIRQYDPSYEVIVSNPTSPSHRRALRIVQRAYARTGWVLPSALDLS